MCCGEDIYAMRLISLPLHKFRFLKLLEIVFRHIIRASHESLVISQVYKPVHFQISHQLGFASIIIKLRHVRPLHFLRLAFPYLFFQFLRATEIHAVHSHFIYLLSFLIRYVFNKKSNLRLRQIMLGGGIGCPSVFCAKLDVMGMKIIVFLHHKHGKISYVERKSISAG